MAQSATATVRIPVSAASYAAAIEGLTRINERILRRAAVAGDGRVPSIYNGRIRYKREPRDVWRHVGDVFKSGWGDCEDLSAARAAALRVTGEDPRAHVAVYQSGPRRYHAIVARGDGSIEDPSRDLGMQPGGRSPMGTLEGDEFDEDEYGQDVDPYAEFPPEETEPTDVYDEPPEESPEAYATYEPPIQYDTPEEPFTPARARGQDIDAWPMTRPAPDEPMRLEPAQPMRAPRLEPRPRPKPKRRVKRKIRRKLKRRRKVARRRRPKRRRRARARRHAPILSRRKGETMLQFRKRVKAQRRARARAIAGACVQGMHREPLGGGAWIGIGDDPDVGAGGQVTFDLYRSGQGWSGIVRVPLAIMKAGRRQALVAKTTPTKARRMRGRTKRVRRIKAKRRTATKAIRLASKISRLPGVQMLIPPQARAAMKVLKSPIGRLATRGAGKLLSKLF